MRTTAPATLSVTTLLALATSACVGEVGGADTGRTRKPDPTDDAADCKRVDAPVTIRGAADFDKLPATCWDLYGKLRVEGAAVTSLQRLGELTAVNDLEIVDTGLTSIDLPQAIDVWGSVTISGNAKLTAIDKLKLQDADDLITAYTIRNNAALTSLGALASAATVEGDLVVRGNPALAQLGTWSGLRRVDGALTIDDNDALVGLGGLAGLQQVGGAVAITNNARLAEVAAVSHLQSIGQAVLVIGNASLSNCLAIEIDHCVASGAVTFNNNKPNTGGTCPACWCE